MIKILEMYFLLRNTVLIKSIQNTVIEKKKYFQSIWSAWKVFWILYSEQISKIRYLGVIFYENFRWNHHVCSSVGKPRSTIYQYIKLRVLLPARTMRLICFSFYQLIFQYGLYVWGVVRDSCLKPLRINHNCVVRIT